MATYTLRKPIKVGDDEVTELNFEEPTIDKLETYEVDLSEKALTSVKGMKRLLTACCTNVAEAHIGRMMASDLSGAIEVCQDFFA